MPRFRIERIGGSESGDSPEYLVLRRGVSVGRVERGPDGWIAYVAAGRSADGERGLRAVGAFASWAEAVSAAETAVDTDGAAKAA